MNRDEIEAWLSKARTDLDAARHLRSNSTIAAEVAAFHYQQAAEKAIKGLLVTAGQVPPHVHDLRALISNLPDPSGIDADVADMLTPFAVLSRYPGFAAQPDSSLLDRYDAFVGSCLELLEGRLE